MTPSTIDVSMASSWERSSDSSSILDRNSLGHAIEGVC